MKYFIFFSGILAFFLLLAAVAFLSNGELQKAWDHFAHSCVWFIIFEAERRALKYQTKYNELLINQSRAAGGLDYQ